MFAHDLDVRPATEANMHYVDEPCEDALPDVKSGMSLDANPAIQSARFFKGDIVHMPQFLNGQRTKGSFIVDKSQYNSRGGYVEYQLLDPLTGGLHKNGAWIREKELKIERHG
ncbi:uncharacterized protein K460DRAFT_408385 [Cucurbitaria berberidis CBS 394.84]|uniref:Uncharacterized protein n=1 Tax=Cucurbitaria berberidis CBS 394.84 TaxID=1168544 RepID=A0A9P4GEP8_9PLEO|nr:uncharacterized protein K460DRAFT_408385 [Cucurbitaria berberidis CBS 394.84]KAF1844079.1 hypothetical protein K460DRAFT_408385 [Cucurbitaria berberidis CBS 394.84]